MSMRNGQIAASPCPAPVGVALCVSLWSAIVEAPFSLQGERFRNEVFRSHMIPYFYTEWNVSFRQNESGGNVGGTDWEQRRRRRSADGGAEPTSTSTASWSPPPP